LDVPFVAVQLPDYVNPKGPEKVFAMRLQQQAGLEGVEPAALVATYDQSCNDQAFPESCPFGSVHNVHKQVVAERVAAQLARLLGEEVVAEGPRVQEVTASPLEQATSGFAMTVRFQGGSTPFVLSSTRNATQGCQGDGAAAEGDFDASSDGVAWVPGHNARLSGGDSVVFDVALAHGTPPAFVRYTAGSNFTQCAVYNSQGFPAPPFFWEMGLGPTPVPSPSPSPAPSPAPSPVPSPAPSPIPGGEPSAACLACWRTACAAVEQADCAQCMKDHKAACVGICKPSLFGQKMVDWFCATDAVVV